MATPLNHALTLALTSSPTISPKYPPTLTLTYSLNLTPKYALTLAPASYPTFAPTSTSSLILVPLFSNSCSGISHDSCFNVFSNSCSDIFSVFLSYLFSNSLSNLISNLKHGCRPELRLCSCNSSELLFFLKITNHVRIPARPSSRVYYNMKVIDNLSVEFIAISVACHPPRLVRSHAAIAGRFWAGAIVRPAGQKSKKIEKYINSDRKSGSLKNSREQQPRGNLPRPPELFASDRTPRMPSCGKKSSLAEEHIPEISFEYPSGAI